MGGREREREGGNNKGGRAEMLQREKEERTQSVGGRGGRRERDVMREREHRGENQKRAGAL